MRTRLKAACLLAACLLAAGGCEFNEFARQRAVDNFVAGQMLAEKGELDAALKELSDAVQNDPTLSVAHAAIGDIHRNRGDYQLAKHAYEAACQTNPYAFRPHYNLGVVCQLLAEAAKTAERAEDLLRQAVAVYLRAAVLRPDDFDASLNLSACYFALGKNAQAEQYCKAAITLKPDSPQAYSNLGIIYDAQDRLYEAVKAYRDSLELDVHQPKLLMNLGATYMRQGRMNPALRTFELAIEEAPDSADAWEQLGTCRYHRKEYADALAAYDKAIAADPSCAAAHRGLGVVYMTQFVLDPNNEDLRSRALAAWHVSLEIRPNQQDIVKLVRKYTPPVTDPNL